MTISMKVLALAFFSPVLFTVALAAQANPETAKFTIVISAEKPEVTPGTNVIIWMTTTNISDELIPLEFGGHGNMPDGFHYDIRNEQGGEVAKAVYNDIRPSRPSGSRRSGQLAPGKSKKDRAIISDGYSFDHPGKYTIRVWIPATRDTPEKPESGRVYSNTITITIVGTEAPATEPQ
jgi:hypothetical protein